MAQNADLIRIEKATRSLFTGEVLKKGQDGWCLNTDEPSRGIEKVHRKLGSGEYVFISGATDAEKEYWNSKVDPVAGKQLSTNDYTNAEKNKLAGIENVEAYGVHEAIKPSSSPFAKSTRTFTIPSGWVFHVGFGEITAGSLSTVFGNVAGDYIVYYKVQTGTLEHSLVENFPLWGVGIPVARVTYSEIASDEITMSWENHGVRTRYESTIAEAAHKTVGMLPELSNPPRLIDGGFGTSILGVTGGNAWDEDKFSSVASKPNDGTAVNAKFYYSGVTSTGKQKLERFPTDFTTATTQQKTKIFVTDVDLGIGVTGRVCYNQFSGGVFQPVAIGVNDVVCMHQFGNDGINDTSALVMGQKVYTGSNLSQSVAAARAGVRDEIKNIKMSDGSARDSIHIGTIIINAAGQKQWTDAGNTTTIVEP